MAKIGEKISVRRFARIDSSGPQGAYLHGTRIGVLVALEGGTAELAHDLAMHIAASNPRYISAAEVPEAEVAKEREILTEQARQEGKSPEIAAKMVAGRLRKSLAEITLLGQPFVKDPDQTIEALLKSAGARVTRIPALRGRARVSRRSQRTLLPRSWRRSARPGAAEGGGRRQQVFASMPRYSGASFKECA